METSTKSITVVITTYNEEKNIKSCIESARLLTQDVLIVDTNSSDRTVEIAKNLGSHVLSFPYIKYVEPSREFAVSRSSGEWVFIIDADERMTHELAEEIKELVDNPKVTHYRLRRKNYFAGVIWLKYGGWYSEGDYQTRLIHKKDFIKWPKEIHSHPEMAGRSGLLRNPLLHYFHPSIENMVEKTILYEDLESDLLYQARKKVTGITFFRKFMGELYRRLFKWQGFRDGVYGVIESLYQAYSKTITYLFLYEKYKKNSHH